MSKEEQAICHYWFLAESVRSTIKVQFPLTFSRGTTYEGLLPELNRLCIWFAFLYILIEGYREMSDKHSSESVEALLSDTSRVDHLRRFRNAVFHFQDEPYHDKMLDFMLSPGVEAWATAVHAAMKNYCNKVFPGFEALGRLRIEFNEA